MTSSRPTLRGALSLPAIPVRLAVLAAVLIAMIALGLASAPDRDGLPKWVPGNPPTADGWPVGAFGCDSDPREQYIYPEAGPGSEINPQSPPAVQGRAYCLEVPHCGLNWISDFDGSFWAVARSDSDAGSHLEVNEGVGTVRLTGANEAEFTEWRHSHVRGRLGAAVPYYEWEWGDRVTLRRLDGPIVIAPCF